MKKYVELLEVGADLNSTSYVKDGKHVARDLKGKEKWALFSSVKHLGDGCFFNKFPEIK
jgi:hypothetical protein